MTTQLEFVQTQPSQNQRLAAYLKARPGEWLAMPDLARVITSTGVGAAVHSRIADCRRKFGMAIAHRSERGKDGQCRSFYRLDPNVAQ
jgi:hypothetical protein